MGCIAIGLCIIGFIGLCIIGFAGGASALAAPTAARETASTTAVNSFMERAPWFEVNLQRLAGAA
jgi:hypothetical protein